MAFFLIYFSYKINIKVTNINLFYISYIKINVFLL